MRLLAAFLLVLVLCGCGGSESKTETNYAAPLRELEFATVKVAISGEVVKMARDGSGMLEGPVDEYIALIRKYEDELEDEDIRRRLTDVANDVEAWCPLCASKLDRVRDDYE